jgi:hypothetical protein
MWRDFQARISTWWNGAPYENEPGSALIFMNSVDRHWSARWAHTIVDYWKEHHRWIIGAGIAVIGLFIKTRWQ